MVWIYGSAIIFAKMTQKENFSLGFIKPFNKSAVQGDVVIYYNVNMPIK